jgi:hypothetical protein
MSRPTVKDVREAITRVFPNTVSELGLDPATVFVRSDRPDSIGVSLEHNDAAGFLFDYYASGSHADAVESNRSDVADRIGARCGESANDNYFFEYEDAGCMFLCRC